MYRFFFSALLHINDNEGQEVLTKQERHGEKMLELVKKQIHMSRSREPVNTQVTLDQDFNVPDSKPDVGGMILKQAEVLLDEVRQIQGRVHIRGRLEFELLYAVEGSRAFQNMTGTLEFEETCGYPGMEPGDYIRCRSRVEDLSIRVINSRKLHISAVLGLTMTAAASCQEDAAWDLKGSIQAEMLGKDIDVMSLQIQKKDTFRIQEQITLPNGKPAVDSLLWESISLRSLEYRPQDASLSVKAEALLFVVYRPEGEQMPLQWIEKSITFQGELPVAGCMASMIPSIEARLTHKEIAVHDDSDGEARILSADAVIELDMKLYLEEKIHLLCDVYSPKQELITEYRPAHLEHLLIKNLAKCKITEKLEIHQKDSMLQICHSQGKVMIDRAEPVKDGILVEGAIQVAILYLAASDERPMQSASGVIPFSHVIEASGIRPGSYFDVCPMLEQLNTMIAAGGEAEVKAIVSFDTLAMDEVNTDLLQQIRIAGADEVPSKEFAPVIGYIVQPEDTLWSIAKHYRVTSQSIREMNEMKNEEVVPGMRLLITR